MSAHTPQGDGEVWYTRPGKRRRAAVVQQGPAAATEAIPVESASEAAGSDRPEAKARSQGNRRRREGTGEGDTAQKEAEDEPLEGAPW